MPSHNFKCIESLEENPSEIFLQVSSILIKLIDNVLLHPSDPKYRKLRLENKLVSSVIIPAIGAMECLFEIGFEEGDDSLLLPQKNISEGKLNYFKTEISNRRAKHLNGSVKSTEADKSKPKEKVVTQTTPRPQTVSQVTCAVTNNVPNSSNPFLAKIQQTSASVLQYEDTNTKKKALSVIPMNEISERVQTKMREHQLQASKSGSTISEASLQESIFFSELMAWFKNDFFKWVNAPKCASCNCDTIFLEMSQGVKDADRVEVYKCGQCSSKVFFPRFNSVTKLLDSRQGRCGEWANTFTSLCRALGWEARLVVDETDHVWTEVYFRSEGRWVHLDPCEAALDKPLLYEKGWGKQLSYILGYSCNGVQDVTWRYSANHSAVLRRRKQCSEQQLVHTINELNKLRQAHLSATRRNALARLTVLELVELMRPAVSHNGDNEGRTSGSLAWRLARHETSLAQTVSTAGPYIWTPTAQQVDGKKIVISYSCGTDEYRIGEETVKGWATRVLAAENMFRKEERDWKTVYLCRTEGSTEGCVSWQVDVSKSGLVVDEVEVQCLSTTFQSGKILWLLCSGDKCIRIQNGHLKTAELNGCTTITLSATLTGGEGDVAWQHAQLFRQPLNATEATFQLCIKLHTQS